MTIIGELSKNQKQFLQHMFADIIAEQWKFEKREKIKFKFKQQRY